MSGDGKVAREEENRRGSHMIVSLLLLFPIGRLIDKITIKFCRAGITVPVIGTCAVDSSSIGGASAISTIWLGGTTPHFRYLIDETQTQLCVGAINVSIATVE